MCTQEYQHHYKILKDNTIKRNGKLIKEKTKLNFGLHRTLLIIMRKRSHRRVIVNRKLGMNDQEMLQTHSKTYDVENLVNNHENSDI